MSSVIINPTSEPAHDQASRYVQLTGCPADRAGNEVAVVLVGTASFLRASSGKSASMGQVSN